MNRKTAAVIGRLDAMGDGRDRGVVPFAGAYWVIPGRLLAGCSPAHRDVETTKSNCAALADAGIRTTIDLMRADESAGSSQGARDYRDTFTSCAGDDARCVRFAVDDMGIPDERTLVEALDAIDAALDNGYGVYVHCFAGRGRTGTIVGCWLARRGLTVGPEVLDVIGALRLASSGRTKPDDFDSRSPETDEQRQFVVEFAGRSAPTDGPGQ